MKTIERVKGPNHSEKHLRLLILDYQYLWPCKSINLWFGQAGRELYQIIAISKCVSVGSWTWSLHPPQGHLVISSSCNIYMLTARRSLLIYLCVQYYMLYIHNFFPPDITKGYWQWITEFKSIDIIVSRFSFVLSLNKSPMYWNVTILYQRRPGIYLKLPFRL